ncbi:cytochrome P450 [Panaeolus papilionaceus]|nr:cytochrome P450 [Panaeolus papilionaceus]
MFPLTVTLSLAAISVLILVRLLAKRLLSPPLERPFPPGPKPRFLIGNTLDIPLADPSKVYYGWSKIYNSSMIHFEALGNRFIVLNSCEDADELLENRARLYSDRPIMPTVDLVAHQHLKPQTIKIFYPTLERKVNNMLVGLLDIPDRFIDHIKMLSLSIPLATMFGYDVRTLDDPVVRAADYHMTVGSEIVSPAGGSLANIFPAFKYVPWTWTWRMSKKCKEMSEEMKRIPLEALMNKMANGAAVTSIVGDFMEKKQTVGASQEEEEIVLNLAHSVYGAGSDTIISAARTFFYLMAIHPAIQAKAQAELDSVLGPRPRLPTFGDRSSSPYIEAIYREVLRWRPPGPMGIPHLAVQDDWYKGYFIPKGTIVLSNIWYNSVDYMCKKFWLNAIDNRAMGLDEQRFGPDTHAFNPERFLNEDRNLNDKDRILAYGFGKRVCVGKHIASSTVTSVCANSSITLLNSPTVMAYDGIGSRLFYTRKEKGLGWK